MTLTELKYIVAVAREKHFGRAAKACFISQPTLSVAVKKLEDELEVKIFERRAGEIHLTPLGRDIVQQAQGVLEQAEGIRATARAAKDPLLGPLRLGVIYTIGPYLLPELVRHNIERTPQMPLMLQENFTVNLLDMLHSGEIDCAILAEPFPTQGLACAALYDEPFVAALPAGHQLAKNKSISSAELKADTLLLLGAGHCWRDHVLQACPEFARFSSQADGISRSFEGSSLETIKHMVAAGLGVTLVPHLSVPPGGDPAGLIAYLPLRADDDGAPPPTRRVALCWRRSFTRYEAIAALRRALGDCTLAGVQWVKT
ncbi:MAG: hydrogen peroxide-inducible genes activator, partial [Ottowia sp.]|nr:hydrogen peroxide-inducible genes activator [Ottowia sp.]